MEHFRDRLTMEFRRSTNAQLPLSLLLARLTPSDRLSDIGDVMTAYGDAAKAMLRKLRGEDSIYLFRPGMFGIVLPGVRAADALRVEQRLGEGLTDASGVSDRFSFSLRAISFPENASSAHQMERAAMVFAAGEMQEKAAA
jgi:GGDEF domain-containing protein